MIAQFSCAIALISSTVVVYEQIGHAKDRSSGYTIDRLMTTGMGTSIKTNYPALRNDLLRSGLVAAVSRADAATTTISNWWNVDDWPGKVAGDNLTMATIAVDADYFQTLEPIYHDEWPSMEIPGCRCGKGRPDDLSLRACRTYLFYQPAGVYQYDDLPATPKR